MIKKIALGIGVVILGVGGALILSRPKITPTPIGINQVTTAGTVTLALTSPNNLAPNATTTIPITMNTTTSKVSAATVELTYDPAKLQISAVTKGTFLTNVLAAAVIANGKVTFTYAAAPDSGGVQGTGTIATLTVKPLVTGQTIISFGASSLVATIGTTTNMLKVADPLTLTTRTATDLNGDKTVNALDYNIFVMDFGKTGTAGFAVSDIDQNGAVNILDYNSLIGDFGKTTL